MINYRNGHVDKRISLKEYILSNYDKYMNIETSLYTELNYLLYYCFADCIPVNDFVKDFDLQIGFMNILRFVTFSGNFYQIRNYGKAYFNRGMDQEYSYKIG